MRGVCVGTSCVGRAGRLGADRLRVGRFERQFRAADRRQLALFGRLGEPHGTVEPVAIGRARSRPSPTRSAACANLFGVRRALEEREVRPSVEFGVARGGGIGRPS